MTIDRVRCFEVSGEAIVESSEERQLQMPDVYLENARRGPAAGSAAPTRVSAIYVEIGADGGPTGIFGPIFAETAFIIMHRLRAHLLGKNALAFEFIWDHLYRQDRHARKGNQMMAVSAVDNALWDLRGKILGRPVYELLGGPTRARVECYASMLGHSLEPTRVRERARHMVEAGYRAEKWFFRHGPAEGLAGMARNIELVRTVREAVGPDIEIMFDFFMGGDATYVARLAAQIEQYRPRWIEEPVPPDRLGDFAEIRRRTNIPLATGEHEYTRWGFLSLLQNEAIDVIQADPDWCGGITELVKIGTLASAYGKQVIPHGHSIHAALHVIASQSPATFPMAEYLLRAQVTKQHFQTSFLVPQGGSIPPPSAPGLGLTIDPARVRSERPFPQ